MRTWDDAIEAFDDLLNDLYDYPLIMGLVFSPAEILQRCDPIAYRSELFNFIDSEGIDSDDLDGHLSV